MQVIQDSAVRSILKLNYDTPSNIMHQEALNKLKLTVSNRLFELSERYVRAGFIFLTFVERNFSMIFHIYAVMSVGYIFKRNKLKIYDILVNSLQQLLVAYFNERYINFII
ncbi:hypothetical protein BpHYR1_033894 [Brachionus plicatilis]|uniref:Uncharacterized protein n=1 Tax=Brachionus plicatilis TaxID=10195 RepID=A0A3M7S6L4_BRAPC|nr:hypothetical protein BpHYR1_033894 [Brachionus plicatilis]